MSTRVQPYLGGPTFPPTDPAKVAILRSEPSRPHERLGEVFAEPSGDPTAAQYEQALREGGAKMGADAVVVVYDRMQVVGSHGLRAVVGALGRSRSSGASWWAWRSATRARDAAPPVRRPG